MTPLLILTHGTVLFVGFIIGIALARWALKPTIDPHRYWNGK